MRVVSRGHLVQRTPSDTGREDTQSGYIRWCVTCHNDNMEILVMTKSAFRKADLPARRIVHHMKNLDPAQRQHQSGFANPSDSSRFLWNPGIAIVLTLSQIHKEKSIKKNSTPFIPRMFPDH